MIAWVVSACTLGLPIAALAQDPMTASAADACPRDACGALVGQVRKVGDRAPVADARVAVVPVGTKSGTREAPAWTRAAVTDAAGRFSLRDLPLGAVEIIVLREGFVRAREVAVIVPDATAGVDIWATPDPHAAYRTVVETRAPDTPGGARALALEREEIRTSPGTQGDALRALQNLPGVARPPGGLGLLVLRGAAPWQSLALVGEHPVPRAFHSLPFAGIVQSEALERVELVPSTASARYGPIAGGVVIMEPRRPRRDGVHGHAQVDLTGANAAVEGPVGRAAYLVAARRGWVDAVLRASEAIDETQTYMLPGLWDYQGWVVVPAGPAELEVRVLGAGDRVRSRFRPSIAVDGGESERVTLFDFRSQFHRVDLVARWKLGRTRVLVTPSFRAQSDAAERPGSFEITRREYATSIRAELETPLAPRARLLVGADGMLTPYAGRTTPLDPSPLLPHQFAEASSIAAVDALAAAYALVHLGRGGWRVSPGVRAQGFVYGPHAAFAVDPRVTSRFALGERVALLIGLGRYSRAAVADQDADGNLVGTAIAGFAPTALLPGALTASFEPSVASSRQAAGLRVITGDQASVTFELDLPWELALHAGAFGRLLRDPGAVAVIPFPGVGPQASEVAPAVRGFDAGAEIFLRKRLSRRLYGWIAYTGMRSIREFGGLRSPGSFDQPHNLVAVVSHGLPRHWRIGGRFRVASGNPHRPVLGAVDFDPKNYGRRTVGVLGVRNSARFPTFHQLDLRVDKRWILHRLEIMGYLDVQNVYNHQNVEAWIYQPDYRSRIGSVGLPIFPSLGVRVDW